MQSIVWQLQLALNIIGWFAYLNNFHFSPGKTTAVHFCQLLGLHPGPNLTLDGHHLPVMETAYLLDL